MDLSYILKQWAERQKQKEAIIFEDKRFTYSELNGRVNALCHMLLDQKLKKGDRVAALTYNNHQFMEIFLACARLGLMMVPLNFRLVGRELIFQLNNSSPEILFMGEEFQETIHEIQGDLESVRKKVVLGNAAPNSNIDEYEKIISSQPRSMPSPAYEVELDDEFLVIYTSGTTGRPKGAVLTQMNVLFTSMNQIIDFQCTKKDITLTLAPLFHAGGCLILTFPMLHVGGTAVILKHFDAESALEIIRREKVSIMFAVPAMWTSIMQEPALKEADLTSLRFAVSGGSSQSVDEMKQFNNTFGVPLSEGYGLSEASSCSTVLMWEFAMEKAGSIGMPFLHNEVKVINEEGNKVKPGEVGEIVQKGLTVMKGYYKLDKETKETITDGWLHTGDLATVDNDGFITIKGRKKEMIISGAENIYPVEIEQVLVTHQKIIEAAVIGIPDEKWGEAVQAFVVLKDGENSNEEEIIDYCRKNLAGYKKPRSVIFMDSLPRNQAGKVQKGELRKQLFD